MNAEGADSYPASSARCSPVATTARDGGEKRAGRVGEKGGRARKERVTGNEAHDENEQSHDQYPRVAWHPRLEYTQGGYDGGVRRVTTTAERT
jgi:hypothetical protein